MADRSKRARRVLLIAYHYPPLKGSSGIQRTLKFSLYLRDHGWEPIVLSAHPRAYDRTSSEQLAEIPEGMIVRRAFALDTSRHLAIRGRYPRCLALPDRWVSWWLGAVTAGIRLIREFQPAAIWSTYPIATAHAIGWTLRRAMDLPWIADFRDSMTEDHYPRDALVRSVYRWIERNTVRSAARVVFTTPGTLDMYAARYPDVPADRWNVIQNGFDEENFAAAERIAATAAATPGGPVRLVHSGLLYPSERDPSCFFEALALLKKQGVIDAGRLRVSLRATGHDERYTRVIRDVGIDDIVSLDPAIPYHEALAEMCSVDGLLMFQAANCNHQIPAKAYEYMRAGRPVLSLTDPAGDTARLLRGAGYDAIARLDSTADIAAALPRFVDSIRGGSAHAIERQAVACHSRQSRAAELARLLDGLVGERHVVDRHADPVMATSR